MNIKLVFAEVTILVGAIMLPVFSQDPAFSTTGPTPPPGVTSEPVSDSKAIKTISGVPAYIWRHGCGPTAVGMVVGYWDGQGLDDLIAGSAATQNFDVQQAIASGGTSASPMTPEQHYEDYARPEDNTGPRLTDDYITASRTPHTDNCIADFMKTSRSADPYQMQYGWSSSIYIIPAITSFAAMQSPYYAVSATQYSFPSSNLTFDLVKTEIDNNRPMVFLVDSTGDGVTDHFVPIIGYDDGPPQQYIYYNTWDLSPHQAQFRVMSSAYTWGVYIGWTFNIVDTNAFRFVQAPHGGWFEEGDPLTMSVTVAGTTGAVTYQWSKDDTAIPFETYASIEIASLAESDEGWYKCTVTDESKGLLESQPVFVEVNPEGSLPVAGSIGIGLALIACCWLGVLKIQRQSMS